MQPAQPCARARAGEPERATSARTRTLLETDVRCVKPRASFARPVSSESRLVQVLRMSQDGHGTDCEVCACDRRPGASRLRVR